MPIITPRPTPASISLDDLAIIAEQLAPILTGHHARPAQSLDATTTARVEAVFRRHGVTFTRTQR